MFSTREIEVMFLSNINKEKNKKNKNLINKSK